MTSYPCPSCRTPATLTSGCPGCGRGPDPDAAEVIRLDAEIAELTTRLRTTDAALRRAWSLREAAVARVRASLASTPPAPTPVPPAPAPRSKEASTRLVQNALFLLGGLLLGVAAIVFTAVAWSQFGVGGRALLLAGFTVAALAAPLAALRRGLTATAETFAAVGLLLVLLDGYAAWYVNLFGVADYSALGYAGAVCAVTAAVAAGYEHVTGLIGPRFGALLVAQPVLPLLVAPFHPDATGWAYTLVAVAVLNLAVVQLRRSTLTALGITAYVLGAGAATFAALTALTDLLMLFTTGAVALAAGALVLAAAVPVLATILARAPRAQSITGGLLVVALAVAASRFVAVAGGSFAAPVLIAAVVTALALLVTVAGRWLPAPVRRGPWTAALLVTAGTGLVVVGVTIAAAITGQSDWRLPAVIVLVTGALTVLMSRPLQPHTALGGLAILAVATPAGFDLPWWTAPGLNLAVVAAALGLALRAVPLWPGAVAAVLTSHAVGVALDRPGVACATFTGVAALGVATAFLARGESGAARAFSARGASRPAGASGPDPVGGVAAASPVSEASPPIGVSGPDSIGGGAAASSAPGASPPVAVSGSASGGGVAAASVAPGASRPAGASTLASVGGLVGAGASRVVGGVALAVGMLAVPAAAWTGAAALSQADPVRSRAALVAAALLVGALRLTGRGYRPYALTAVLLSVVSAPLWALATGDSPAIYAAIGLLLVALTFSRTVAAAFTAVPLGAALLVATAPSLAGVLLTPYGWLDQIWTGRPTGTGTGRVTLAAVVALGILAMAIVVAVQAASGRRAAAWAAAPVVAVIAPMGFAAAGVPWPGVPAESLIIGLAGLVAVALRRTDTLAGDGAPGEPGAVAPARPGLLAGGGESGGSGLLAENVASDRSDAVAPGGTGAGESGAVAGGAVAPRRSGAVAGGVVAPGESGAVAGGAVAPRRSGAVAGGVVAPGESGAPGKPGAVAGGAVAPRRPGALGGAVALRRSGAAVVGVVMACAALVGAGLAGALPTRGATLAALGLTLVAGAVAGVGGRALAARLAGWLAGAGATVAFAYTVGRAAELSPETSAFVVLGAAAAILAVGALLAARRSVEGRTVQAAAHAGAFVALLLTAGSIRHAAAVCTFWGVALGVRALRPGERATVRRGHALAAAVAELGGWWLLVASEQVATVEAYTLPAAAVALLAGWLARRTRAGLSSWVTYGPALAAALLPSLASVLADEGQPMRRLLLGVGALAVLLAGAYRQLRAPVVAGGAVLAVVALHEVVLVWDLLPRWIPLAAAGLLLVGLAMTLERRRRDLARVRAALSRMS